jgi:hypothetical protein
MGYGFGVVSVAFLFDGVLNGRYSKIGVECGVSDIPWCICYHS